MGSLKDADCKHAISCAGLPEVKGATGKKALPANVAFGGTLTATRSRVPGGTLGASQPGSPARARPRQVSTSLGLFAYGVNPVVYCCLRCQPYGLLLTISLVVCACHDRDLAVCVCGSRAHPLNGPHAAPVSWTWLVWPWWKETNVS